MAGERDPEVLEKLLKDYKRLLDSKLDSITIEAIRQLVKEIEEKIAKNDPK